MRLAHVQGKTKWYLGCNEQLRSLIQAPAKVETSKLNLLCLMVDNTTHPSCNHIVNQFYSHAGWTAAVWARLG